MRFTLRLAPRSLLVLVLGTPWVLWLAYRYNNPQYLLGGLAAVAVLTLLLSIHLAVPRAPRPGSPASSDPTAAPPTVGVATPDTEDMPPEVSPSQPSNPSRPTVETLAPSRSSIGTGPLSVPVRRPSTRALKAEIDRYRAPLEAMALNPSPAELAWMSLEPEIKATFATELSKIQPFVDDVLVILRPGGYLQLQQDINEAANFLTTGAWCVGRSTARAHPQVREALATANAEEIAVIPPRYRGPIEDAIEYAQWVFVSVFHPYYASIHGEKVRGERDGHFMDMYRMFTRVAVSSFLAGLRSI